MTSKLKTLFFLALLSGLLLFIGQAMGGQTGLVIAFGLALFMNFGSYWFSDKIVLRMYKAREVSQADAPMLHAMVEELAHNAGIPKPKICIVPDQTPNAFATGRNPEHAVVAVTEGILRILSADELRGVIAHEIGHIANSDILLQSIASIMATTIMYLANMLQFAAIFGGGRSSDGQSSGGNAIGALLLALLAPMAAGLIQMALSRSREYLADETGAKISGKPQALASALHKLSTANAQQPLANATPATESMFIVSPLLSGGLKSLFSTHPPIEERIRRLQNM